MSEPFIGEVRMAGFNFAPRGWAFCNGQVISIAQNTALFSLLGTTYGGNGQTTFALPNLQGRVPMHTGQGPGLSNRVQGEQGGSANVTLLAAQMPAHSHALATAAVPADRATATGNRLAQPRDPVYRNTPPDGQLDGAAIGASGGSLPHNNLSPYLVVNFIIALQGVFPSRN